MAQILDRVAAGETVVVTKSNECGTVGKYDKPVTFTVQGKCEHNNGRWVCATHKTVFSNQFCKDSHIHAGSHRLGWFCFQCGSVQVP